MNVTSENFDAAYDESLRLLDAYADSQVTEDQKSQARHYKHHVTTNRSYWLGCLERGEYLAICVNCGAIHGSSYMKPYGQWIKDSGKCFHCVLWENEIVPSDKPGRLIIDGHIYGDGGNKPGADSNHTALGFAGHIWKIEKDGKVWETNNLWSGGTIPQEHRAALPDNARFVK